MPSELTEKRSEGLRVVLAVFKLTTGTIELIAGTLFLAVSAGTLNRRIQLLLDHERLQDPNDIVVRFVERHLGQALGGKTAIGLTLIVLGLLKVVAAIGLLRRKPWGYWLLVATLAAFLPFDAIHTVRHHTVLSFVILAANAGFLIVLLVFRRSFLAHATGEHT